MSSDRRQKYLRAMRVILTLSLMMMAFYAGRWSVRWDLANLVACVVYIAPVLVYFRAELREHRRDLQQFREYLRQCEQIRPGLAEEIEKGTWRPRTGPLISTDVDATDKAFGYRSFKCPKCGRLSHIPEEVKPYCIECLFEFKSAEWRG